MLLMKIPSKLVFAFFLSLSLIFIACNDDNTSKETANETKTQDIKDENLSYPMDSVNASGVFFIKLIAVG